MTDSQENYRMAGIGEILWDILPTGRKLGGSPMNVVYHCQAAGINSTVISAIGTDSLGTDIIEQMRQKNVSENYIQFCPDLPTGTVTVKLNEGIPDFTIHPDVAWDEIQWNERLQKLATSLDAVAYGSLSQRNNVSRTSIRKFIQSMKPNALRVFDINLRQNFHSADLITKTLELSNILKINNEELPILSKYLKIKGNTKDQILSLINKYSLKMVVYTMGAFGSWLVTKNTFSEMKATKIKIADTVGAGDAFTGVLIAGLLNQKSLQIIHREATDIAAWVCTMQGATPPYKT